MYNSFLSIIGVIEHPGQFNALPTYLQFVYQQLSDIVTDFEIILVNNSMSTMDSSTLSGVDEPIRRHVFLLQLASSTNKNNAIVAGLDRANGDYAIVYDFVLLDAPPLIKPLFQKSQNGFDIVYLRSPEKRRISFFNMLWYRLFYSILKQYSPWKIDERAYDSRIISRRALNSLLKLRENVRFLKGIYSIVGYQTTHLTLATPLAENTYENFSERFKTSLVAITSFTTFLRSVMLFIFVGSSIFAIAVIMNALRVYFFGLDLFGNTEQAVEGWTFLVVLISIFSSLIFLTLYIMSIYLSNIYQEIKQRPLYIIESVKRF
ncbi:MAG: glycosyltransferase [Saprospiraceae bacterium]|nr:glycosyltransferase [Saprospiraceae bacterium]